jgi:hypothetical protein
MNLVPRTLQGHFLKTLKFRSHIWRLMSQTSHNHIWQRMTSPINYIYVDCSLCMNLLTLHLLHSASVEKFSNSNQLGFWVNQNYRPFFHRLTKQNTHVQQKKMGQQAIFKHGVQAEPI